MEKKENSGVENLERKYEANLDASCLESAKREYERARISGDKDALKKAIQDWEEAEKVIEKKKGFSFLR